MAPQTLRLAPHLDMPAASLLRGQLLRLRGHDVELDGSAVMRLGALCLQVLLSAARTWRQEGRAFRIIEPSRGLTEGLRQLGAAPALESAEEN
jgi:chemotaxis protein CheX